MAFRHMSTIHPIGRRGDHSTHLILYAGRDDARLVLVHEPFKVEQHLFINSMPLSSPTPIIRALLLGSESNPIHIKTMI